MNGQYKRFAPIGLGGRKCSCCFPTGKKTRPRIKRQDERKVRRAIKHETQKLMFEC